MKLINAVFAYLMKHRIQLSIFVAVGLSCAAIYFSCFYMMYTRLQWDYRIASLIAYVFTVSCHFLLNRFITFHAGAQNVTFNGIKYVLMLCLNYVIMLSIVFFSVKVLHRSPYFGLLLSNCTTPMISFLLMKYFVFTSKNEHNTQHHVIVSE